MVAPHGAYRLPAVQNIPLNPIHFSFYYPIWVINFKKVHAGKLRSQPPSHRVVAGPQNKDLGSASANTIPYLVLAEFYV